MTSGTTQCGLYLAAFFDDETNEYLERYMEAQGIPNAVPTPSLHTTIVYSRNPIDMEPLHTIDVIVHRESCSFEVWDTPSGNTLVLKFFSPYFQIRFNEAMAMGASYDYDEYKPHISLSYDVGDDFDVTQLPPIDFDIRVVGEYAETVDDSSE